MDAIYDARIDALERTWRAWAERGAGLGDEQWRRPTRCTGWDVAAVYAHHSAFPTLLAGPWPPVGPGAGPPVTAAAILRRYNAPGGVAHTMAGAVADRSVADAAACSALGLVGRFTEAGPAAIRRLRDARADDVVAWPAAHGVVTLVEGLRILLMEATVHLLDVERALDVEPAVPEPALWETVQLLAELAPAVELIEAATGRSAGSPLPVLR